MSKHLSRFAACLLAVLIVFVNLSSSFGQDSGQADLDRATEVKLGATSMEDLQKTIELCQTAMRKGLDEQNMVFAKQLVTSTLLERATRLSQPVFDKKGPHPRWPLLRMGAIKDLEKSLTYDDSIGSVHLLIARLQLLPKGDKAKAQAAAIKAVELLEDNDQISTALVTRAAFETDAKKRIADYDQAIKLNSRNAEAWRARGSFQLSQGNHEEALSDFLALVEQTPNDMAAHEDVVSLMTRLNKFDVAYEHLDKAIEQNPESPIPYILRSRIEAIRGNVDSAIEDVSAAIDIQPQTIPALLQRATLFETKQAYDDALADVETVLELKPKFPQAILLRSLIYADKNLYDRAIDDMKSLMRKAPNNPELMLQLGSYYIGNNQPSRAIGVFTEAINLNKDNWLAYRSRGDARLSLGRQTEAITDYETALKLNTDDGGILNNLAWILATSPNDQVRDGSRALELAQKACEQTKYEQAHILSTLAASYAEMGDFENATKWSAKAVELDKDEEQLAKELENYKQKKPWRERQQVQDLPAESEPSKKDLELESAAN